MHQLTEAEWRTIHNALAVYQCEFASTGQRQIIQRVMDKVRDNIAETENQQQPTK